MRDESSKPLEREREIELHRTKKSTNEPTNLGRLGHKGRDRRQTTTGNSRHTERRIDRQTGRETDRQTNRGREADGRTDKEIDRQTDRESDRHADRQSNRYADMLTGMDTTIQTDSHRDKLLTFIHAGSRLLAYYFEPKRFDTHSIGH